MKKDMKAPIYPHQYLHQLPHPPRYKAHYLDRFIDIVLNFDGNEHIYLETHPNDKEYKDIDIYMFECLKVWKFQYVEFWEHGDGVDTYEKRLILIINENRLIELSKKITEDLQRTTVECFGKRFVVDYFLNHKVCLAKTDAGSWGIYKSFSKFEYNLKKLEYIKLYLHEKKVKKVVRKRADYKNK